MKSIAELAEQTGYKKVEIDGILYQFELLPAFPAMEVGAKLIEVFGPGFGALIDNVRREEYILPEDSTLFSEVSIELSKSLGSVDVQQLITTLLFNVTANGNKVDLNRHFQGKIHNLIILIEKVLKENFGGSFLEYCKAKGLSIPSLSDLKSLIGQKEQTTEE